MFQKIFSRIIIFLSLAVIFGGTLLTPVAVHAEGNVEVKSEEGWYITEISNPNPDEETLLAVEENGDRNYITKNLITNEVYLNGVLIETEIINGSIEGFEPDDEQGKLTPDDYVLASGPRIDYLTRLSARHNIPVQGIAALTAAISSLIPGVGWAIAQEMAMRVAVYGPEYAIITYNQYKSIESYYSNYHGVYYNKAINRDIRTYRESSISSNLVHGPVHGSWFDPIRP